MQPDEERAARLANIERRAGKAMWLGVAIGAGIWAAVLLLLSVLL